MLLHQFSISVNHVYALAILISTFHYSKNVSAIDQVKVFEFSVFGSSQLVSLKIKGDNSFFLFQLDITLLVLVLIFKFLKGV